MEKVKSPCFLDKLVRSVRTTLQRAQGGLGGHGVLASAWMVERNSSTVLVEGKLWLAFG